MRDLHISTGDDVAFCHSLNRVSSTRTTGEHTDTWVRVTVGFRKIEGRWLVTHEHVSVPFDMETSKASLDLTP
jgi:ketosteroid isomerase-like protein